MEGFEALGAHGNHGILAVVKVGEEIEHRGAGVRHVDSDRSHERMW